MTILTETEVKPFIVAHRLVKFNNIELDITGVSSQAKMIFVH